MEKSKICYQILLSVFVLFCLVDCTKKEKEKEIAKYVSFVQPPIPTLDVDYTNFTFEAEQGGKFTYKTSTEIVIEPNSLVDSSGKPVKGAVTLQYREFHDAVDVFLSGIPMQYDSAGVKQNLQTAGMYDIRAFQKNNPLQIKTGKTAKVRMASWQAENDYNFYALDTLNRKWDYETTKNPEINIEKVKMRQAIEAMRPFQMKDLLLVNFGQALDIAYNYESDYNFERVKSQEKVFVQKVASYGVNFLKDVRLDAEIIFQGNKYPAFNMVWQKLEDKTIPNWVKTERIYEEYIWSEKSDKHIPQGNLTITPLGNGNYQMNIRHEGQYFSLQMKPLMRISSFFQYSPAQWQSQYAEMMEKIRKEEEKLLEIAEVFRPIEVSQFGIYNFDRFLKEPEALVVDADFGVESEKEKPTKIYMINKNLRAVVPYNPGQWKLFSILPDTNIRIFAVLPDYSVAQYSKEKLKKIDFKDLKSKGKMDFVLSRDKNLAKSKEDLKKALGM